MNDKNDLLKSKRMNALLGGGQEKAAKQKAMGKMTARERIAYLCDPSSFMEIGTFVRHNCQDFSMADECFEGDGVVTGIGTIEGRKVCVYAQDFTVMGGSLGKMHGRKIARLLDMALTLKVPVIGLNDSGGARIQEGVDSLSGYGEIFYRNSRASGIIPQITAIMGPCAGGAVYSPALTDFIFMVDRTSQMFITGPQVIKAVTGEEIDAQSLGGSMTHSGISGVCQFAFPDDSSTLDGIKRLLTYLPQNCYEKHRAPVFGDIPLDPVFSAVVPTSAKKSYDMKNVIPLIADDWMEVSEHYARNIITAFAHIGGMSIGIVASQPNCMAGCIDINASDKAARFIRFCDSFNIPILTLEDVTGFLPGIAQEKGGIIRHGAKMIYAYSECTVPLVTVILRKAYGGAYISMASKELGADMVFAWPDAEIAVMGSEGAVNILYRKEIKSASDPASFRAAKMEEYEEKFSNPYQAAKNGYVDDVILPEETKRKVLYAFAALDGKEKHSPEKKHGNIPL